jgi:hypothetical protein
VVRLLGHPRWCAYPVSNGLDGFFDAQSELFPNTIVLPVNEVGDLEDQRNNHGSVGLAIEDAVDVVNGDGDGRVHQWLMAVRLMCRGKHCLSEHGRSDGVNFIYYLRFLEIA